MRAAIAMPWSNGLADGQITRLTLVKRQMYGSGKIELLEDRRWLNGAIIMRVRQSHCYLPTG